MTQMKSEQRPGHGVTLPILLVIAFWLAGCSGAPDEDSVEVPQEPAAAAQEESSPEADQADEPAVQTPPPAQPPAATGQPGESAEETRWKIAVFAGVNGEFGGLGEGSLTQDADGNPTALGVEYFFDEKRSRIVMRNGRVYLGIVNGGTKWIDVTDQVGDVSQVTTTLLQEEEDDYLQLREQTYGGVRYRIFGKMGEIVALDDGSAIGSRFLYWQDDAGEIRRHVSIVSLRAGGNSVALITVTDRDDGATLPDWYGSAASDARFSAVRAAPALRYNLGMAQPQATLPAINDRSMFDAALNLFIADAEAQIVGAVALDLKDEVLGDLEDAVIKDFLQNLPPPGSSLSDYMTQLGRSGYTAIKNYFTPEQIVALGRSALQNALKKVLTRSVIQLAPYMGYYGLAALVVGFVVDEVMDWLFSSVHGEPHIRSFDGRGYSFQAAGEFVYFSTPDLEVQQRFMGSKGSATSAQATAVRVGDHVIETYFAAVGSRDEDMPVILDGVETTLDEEGISFEGGGFVGRLSSDPKYHNLIAIAPGGSYVVVENLNVSQNVLFAITPDTQTKIDGGLGGVPDGNTSNDFTLRDGTVLDADSISEIENMYGQFAASWRVIPEERLFTRGTAADFLTPEYTDVPTAVVRLSDFSQDERDRARLICRDAGVMGDEALDDCAYDVLVTGDPAWAQASANSQVVQSMLRPEDLGPAPAAVRTAPAPQLEPVSVQLTASIAGIQDDLQWILINQDTEETTIPETSAPLVDVMLAPGTYDVIISGSAYEAETIVVVTAGGDNVFDIPLVSTTAPPPFDAPTQVPAGEIVRFTWRGPGAEDDLIFIAPLTMAENTYRRSNRHDATDPSEAVLVTPAVPGGYEIRYFSYANGAVLFRQPIEITEPRVEITVPAEVNAGAPIAAAWTGPNLPDDGLFVARQDMEASRYWRGELYHDVEDGSPTDLVAPIEPGDYEIRYYSNTNGLPLIRQPLVVLLPSVEIDAPRATTAGAEFEFSWTGPGADGDFLFIATPDMDANEYWRQGRHFTADGPTGTFIAPGDAGTYEIRYYSNRNAGMLAKRALVVR